MTICGKNLSAKLLALAIASVSLTGCFDKTLTLGDYGKQHVSVTAFTVPTEAQTLTPILNVVGKAAVSTVGIQSRISATVQRVAFTPGKLVKKGDVLIQFDEVALKASVVKSEQQYQEAKKAYRRAVRARDKAVVGSADQPVIDAAKVDAQQAQDLYIAALASRNNDLAALRHSAVLAPFDGIPGPAMVREGDQVTANSGSLVLLTPPKSQWVEFDLSASDYQALTAIPKSTPEVTLTFSDGSTSQAAWMAPAPSKSAEQSVSMRAEPQPPTMSFIQGDEVQVEIHGKPIKGLISLPKSALRENTDGYYVFVVADSKVEMREVKVIRWAGGDPFVLSGLSQGDQIVTSNFTKIRVGSKSNVVVDVEASK
ncbi:efflux RND transporter periplasmic adaptor subunit [Pseudomonas putida]|uniref:Efflux RND transporter periplasmic adaptor subunit n=1 Tax=Pseudomonas putida TaxID=303 RepID=A0A8I1EC32_PSEPU|nr:efflux RND transporter periplasmic adaptor subunit [Pseudomonas putida]MBI6882776.1 efflux RND transporter periplasmic adaptor subunit [Pseudomonas putida]